MEDYELAMCRVCLADDVRMCLIVNTHLQEVYESLTLMPLEAQDRRPVQVCYICYAVLQNSYRLRKRSLQSEELFTRVLSWGVLQPVNILESCPLRLRVVHPVIRLSIGDVVQNGTHDETTEDSADRTEAPDVVVNVKVEREDAEGTNKIKLEIEDIILDENGRDKDGVSLSSQLTEEMKLDIEEIVLEDFGRQPDDVASSQSADNVWPKIEKEVLEGMVLNDTRTGTSDLKRRRLATHKISIETTSSKHNRNEQAETTVAEHESVADKPVIISEIQQTIDKVDATLHKRTSENNICLNKTSFRSKSRLQCHTRTRAGEKLFECDVCKKCFKLKSNLTTHMRTHTGEKPYMCKMCNKCFTQKTNLRRHISTHTAVKPFSCDICDKCFSKQANLDIHRRTHAGEKPYKCNMCNKCFTRETNLDKHKRAHIEEKPFPCDLCNKSFSKKSQLDIHTRTHTDRKPHMCNVCKKCFTQIASLRCHMRIHTGEKPYVCDVFKKCFTHMASLTCHVRTHTGEKPYVCDVCKKSFKDHGTLRKHTRTHTGVKPYTCDVCGKRFSFRYAMKRHKCIHNKNINQTETPMSPLFLKSGLGY